MAPGQGQRGPRRHEGPAPALLCAHTHTHSAHISCMLASLPGTVLGAGDAEAASLRS